MTQQIPINHLCEMSGGTLSRFLQNQAAASMQRLADAFAREGNRAELGLTDLICLLSGEARGAS
jgi:uncharacterized protein YjgD (DUF1641 family)